MKSIHGQKRYGFPKPPISLLSQKKVIVGMQQQRQRVRKSTMTIAIVIFVESRFDVSGISMPPVYQIRVGS